MDIKALLEQYNEYVVERRRFYHTCPELSGEEKETRAQIKRDLEALGVTDIKEMETCYGLIADIHGGKPGKTVALRSDIDALSVNEESDLPFASKVPGKMHACGHDSHIAVLLGAAKILNEVKDELCGTVRLIFQPAEEVATGALAMLKEGVMEGVDALYGSHVWSLLDAPYINVQSGNRMACCHGFTIKVEGMSAHASQPQNGIDAIMAACAIANSLQQCVSRMNDPLNPMVLTIGRIDGGNRWNVLPGRCVMEGTVRTFATGTVVEDRMRKVIEDTAAAFGATATLEYNYMTVPVINDARLAQIAQGSATKLFGEDSLVPLAPAMGSEDFSWFGESGVPYVYAFVGSYNEKFGTRYSNHHEKYDVDEAALERGTGMLVQFAVDFLAEG